MRGRGQDRDITVPGDVEGGGSQWRRGGWRRERGQRREPQQVGTLIFSFGFFCSFLVVFSLNAFLAFSQLLALEFIKFIGCLSVRHLRRNCCESAMWPLVGRCLISVYPLQRLCGKESAPAFLPSAVGLEQGSAATFFFIELASLPPPRPSLLPPRRVLPPRLYLYSPSSTLSPPPSQRCRA